VMEKDLLGKIYSVYNVENGVHHDIFELPNGNLLLSSENTKSDTIEDYILEMDRQTGDIVRTFDLKNILDANRPHEINWPANDWLHLNSIDYDPTDSSIIISSRAQSAVIKLSYPSMQIKWILGSHDNWPAKFQPYLLTPVGAGFEWPWSQHHATLLGPDLPGDNIVDIQLFDDGLYRSFDPATMHTPGESYSRIVHYRINEKDMTVEQVWEYGKSRGSEIFSNSMGSVYLMPNGNMLGDWGDIAKDAQGNPETEDHDYPDISARIIEVNPQTNTVEFEAKVVGQPDYRTMRMGFYDSYSDANNYTVTAINDTSANDLLDRSQMAWYSAVQWVNQQILEIKRLGRKVINSL